MTELSLVIRGGVVHDGLGGEPRELDIGIAGDRIAFMGQVPETSAPRIDATGLAVSPGFINTLSQAWQSIQVDGTCFSDLTQGVTTQVFGEGVSLGPTTPTLTRLIRTRAVPDGVRLDFRRLSDGLDCLEKLGVSVNVASFLGGSNLRVLGAGLDDRPLTPEELDGVRAVVAEEMAEGALGVATALIYPPDIYWSTDQLVGLCEVVAAHDGLYISHLRSEGDRFIECLGELLEIGDRSGVRVEVYHLKAAGVPNFPKMAEAIELIASARAEGRQVSANMYPYTAAGTALAATIPPRFHAGGTDRLNALIADPMMRREIRDEMRAPSADFENLFLGAGSGDGMLLLADLADGTPTAGLRIPDIGPLLGLSDPLDIVLEILNRDSQTMCCYFVMDEANVRLGLQQPWVSIGSDAETSAPWLAGTGFEHPRGYGSFARIIGHYSRDLGMFSLPEAIRKMTSMPAETFRLKDRGRLEVGAFADVIAFDPAAVEDPADYTDPRQFATGMRHVVVNGSPVLADGRVLPARPGRRLRRGR